MFASKPPPGGDRLRWIGCGGVPRVGGGGGEDGRLCVLREVALLEPGGHPPVHIRDSHEGGRRLNPRCDGFFWRALPNVNPRP